MDDIVLVRCMLCGSAACDHPLRLTRALERKYGRRRGPVVRRVFDALLNDSETQMPARGQRHRSLDELDRTYV